MRKHHELLGRGALMGALVTLLLACDKHESNRNVAQAATANDAGPHGPPVVRVDASLLSAGRIATAPALRRALRGDVRLTAEVVSSESGAADVGALLSGRIATIEVREGDSVKRGQVLAYVDSPEAARVAADLIHARARLFAATRKVERQVALERDRATSPAAVDEARVEQMTAEADTAASKTMLSSLGMAEPRPSPGGLPARVPVRSPIEGVVVERAVSLGASVAPDKTLFRVVAREQVVVDARWAFPTTTPPPRDTRVKLTPRGADFSVVCDAKVVMLLGVVDDRTRAQRLRIAPSGPCAFLVAGAYVDASFSSSSATNTSQTQSGSANIVVPKDAVVDVRGGATVFVARAESGAFEAHAVRVGRTSSEDVEIEDGLTDGMQVASVGSVLLKGELLRAELESQ